MKYKILIFAALINITFNANASNWKTVSVSDTGDTRYVDVDSLITEKNTINFWVLTEYAKSQISDSKIFKSSKDKLVVNCITKEFGMLLRIDYEKPKGNGEVVNFSRYSGQLDAVAPGTVGETLLNFSCSNKK
jgi:hypothetical protein